MADDGTRWSHTSGEAEELNKLTTNYEIVNSSGKKTREDREKRKKEREQREKEEQKAKEEAKGKGNGNGK
ncbi:hypothetical protein G7Y89_g2835 [Cudoniella acicularis]|uniref:Uncharacterized protein n=1 Tax=Cudoniella acicularis TaxID=354080 RepID=A0A8H4W8Z4_9HELO|nr:hypothetical protein G7Y89_g2835 [Cudoniella acicularis]